jgi:hypothetical protein
MALADTGASVNPIRLLILISSVKSKVLRMLALSLVLVGLPRFALMVEVYRIVWLIELGESVLKANRGRLAA